MFDYVVNTDLQTHEPEHLPLHQERGERILSIVNNEIKMFFEADDECEGSSRGDSPLHYERSADWNVEPLGEREEREEVPTKM